MSNAEMLKNLFGLDTSELEAHGIAEPDYPQTVPGRVLNIDGDFLAYQVSADDEKSLEDMMHNFDVSVETLRLLAGAESTVSHLTCRNGDKGNRYNIAIQKEYQGSRKDKEKPKYLEVIKHWMVDSRGAVNHSTQEADDGLCQANVAAIDAGTPELSVLVSRDKDLQMCPGYHLDWMNGGLELVEGFGYVNLDRSKSTPKIVGKGTAYFWAQMLTGDGADDIQGLPKVPGRMLNAIKPTKPVIKALEKLQDSTCTAKQAEKATAVLEGRKPGACGPVIAAEIMSKLKDDRMAFHLVKTLYENHGDHIGYKHWETGEDVPWQEVFVSEAKLLWMRLYPGENDVLDFFKTRCQ